MIYWVLLLCFFLTYTHAGSILVEEDSVFDCSSLPTDYLSVNPDLVAAIQTACVMDVHCAALFAPEEVSDVTTFTALLQIAQPHSDPLAWQSPMLEVLCGKTVDEALALMWIRSLITSVRNLHICAPDEQFELIGDGTEAECQPMLHSTYNSPGNYYGYILSALIGIVILMSWIVGVQIYRLLKASQQ